MKSKCWLALGWITFVCVILAVFLNTSFFITSAFAMSINLYLANKEIKRKYMKEKLNIPKSR